ncbi:MAG TPA: AraC family transcriptional regulator [Burkholderiaceae bacterium]|nr:AraC family transcriptional regulator [Burkholderiaceae bacterium]
MSGLLSDSTDRTRAADAFHMPGDARSLKLRQLSKSTLTVTELEGGPNHGRTDSFPYDDAYAIVLQHVACPDHDIFLEGRHHRPKNWVAGVTSFFDLRRDPVVDLRDPFHSYLLYLPRKALHDVADEAGAPRIDDLRYQPDVSVVDPVLRHLLGSLKPALENPAQAPALFVDAVGLAISVHLAHTYGGLRAAAQPGTRGGLAPWQERRAKEMMSANLDGEVPLARLAAECGLSVRHFSRAFRQSTGVPPHRWLLKRRVELAKNLLLSPAASLAEVGRACGFADQSHFTRVFSASTGASPGAWRRRGPGSS